MISFANNSFSIIINNVKLKYSSLLFLKYSSVKISVKRIQSLLILLLIHETPKRDENN